MTDPAEYDQVLIEAEQRRKELHQALQEMRELPSMDQLSALFAKYNLAASGSLAAMKKAQESQERNMSKLADLVGRQTELMDGLTSLLDQCLTGIEILRKHHGV